MGLIERIDAVCKARDLSDRGWSLKAKLSERYITVQRSRAAEDPNYRLPERGAEKLAAAANVSLTWLRTGEGSMEPVGMPSVTTSSSPRATLIETLARSIADMTSVGDMDGARSATGLLSTLLNVPPSTEAHAARVLEHDEEGDEDHSHQRRKFTPPKTGT